MMFALIDPLDYASNPDGALMNFVTGQIVQPDVDAVNLERKLERQD